ncbi:peroxiredoxin family protein [Frigoriglobus tundricola]|uniref:peroxiredoxin family protein n=1 Tax=Frigoriglobus tundricola TaxID=2774151 RepID=UPI00148ECABB|nr:hypothetical protein [Frigoriglobus tundricola]
MFPPRPPKTAADKPWAVASADTGRPAETWQAQGTDLVTAERCALIVMNQAHANWAAPVGGKLAWHRADAAWVARDGIAHKVHRVIKHRDGLARELAAWVEVKYELTSQTCVNGRLFDRYRRDVEFAFAAAADVAPLLPDARLHAARFEKELKKLDLYLADADNSSPYREAVLAVRRQIDAARRGEAVSPFAPAGWLSSATVPKRAAWPEPGRLAPDFTAGPFRLADARGRPVVLVFFKPGSETTDLTLAVADALHQKYGTRSDVVPLAVWGDAAAGVKDRDRRKLTVPIYDGTQAETAFGVDSVPRFVVLDGGGVVQWTFSGVGAETGHSAREQLERLLPAVAPGAPDGTIHTPAPGTAAPARRP